MWVMWENISNILNIIIFPIAVFIIEHRSKKRELEARLRNEAANERLEEKVDSKDLATQEAVKALLRERIIAIYHEFRPKGYIDLYSRDGVDRMYDEYKNLGGNSTVDSLMIHLKEIPVISDEELLEKMLEDKKRR